MALRILLVDDETIIRQGLRALLEQAPYIEVVGEADDGWPAVHLARQLRPDLVLMDLHLPGLSGFEAIRLLAAESPPIKCLAMSSFRHSDWVLEAFKAGARGFLPKKAALADALEAFAAVMAGLRYLHPDAGETALDRVFRWVKNPNEVAWDPLTARQREILRLICKSKPSGEIARLLGVSAKTIELERAEMMRKADVHKVEGLVLYAVRAGLVPPTETEAPPQRDAHSAR